MSAPYYYDVLNQAMSSLSPSTYHCSNTALHSYYVRYLIQQAIAQFDWTLPEEWDKDYFLYVLYCWGYIGILESSAFGVIPQQCTLRGLNLYYHPTNIVVANPVLNRVEPGLHDLEIGVGCEVLHLQPDYGPILDKVSYYADMMALCDESAGINLINSQLSYVLYADNKVMAETLKKLFDKLHSGEPAVAITSKAHKDGMPSWEPFAQNVGQNFIADKIMQTKSAFKDMFLTDLGIPNSNTEKKERLLVDEVNANNVETALVPDLWLSMLKDQCKRVRNHFGITLDVDWRFDPAKGGVDNAGDDVNSGTSDGTSEPA